MRKMSSSLLVDVITSHSKKEATLVVLMLLIDRGSGLEWPWCNEITIISPKSSYFFPPYILVFKVNLSVLTKNIEIGVSFVVSLLLL